MLVTLRKLLVFRTPNVALGYYTHTSDVPASRPCGAKTFTICFDSLKSVLLVSDNSI